MNRSVEELERLSNEWILGDGGIQRGTLRCIGRHCGRGEFHGEGATGRITKNGRDPIHVGLHERRGRRAWSPEPDPDPVMVT